MSPLRHLNTIDIIPAQIKAHQAVNWQQKESTTNVQFGGQVGAIEKTMDWSFASPYKGTIGPLRQAINTIIPTEFSAPEDVL